MPEHEVSIDANGSFSPRQLQLEEGDTVHFVSRAADAVLCIDDSGVFGDDRYEIPAEQSRTLTVQSGAPSTFEFIARMGNLNLPCRGSRDRTSGGGGGTVGGGDG